MEWANNMPALNRTFLWTGLQMPSYSMLTSYLNSFVEAYCGAISCKTRENDSIVFLIQKVRITSGQDS